MRRGITIFLLAAGAIAGFTIGFGRLRYGYGHGCGYGHGAWGNDGWGHDRVAFENHIADVCTRAAERSMNERPKAPPASPAPQPPAAPQ